MTAAGKYPTSTRGRATVPPVLMTLRFPLTGDNCFEGPLPKSEAEWRFQCYQSKKEDHLLRSSNCKLTASGSGIVKRVQKDKKKTRSWTYSVALRQLLLWRSSELVSVAIIGNEGIQSVSDKRGLKAANGPGAKMTVTASLSKSGLKIQ